MRDLGLTLVYAENEDHLIILTLGLWALKCVLYDQSEGDQNLDV